MTIDTDLATLYEACEGWPTPNRYTDAHKRVETELARLRDERRMARASRDDWERQARGRGVVQYELLARAEAAERELARLRQERHKWLDIADELALKTVPYLTERYQAAERELARLREGLRPESLARLFHETYERLAPDHGYKTREESAVLWEDVPSANRALMIATADAVARALLADTAKDGQ